MRVLLAIMGLLILLSMGCSQPEQPPQQPLWDWQVAPSTMEYDVVEVIRVIHEMYPSTVSVDISIAPTRITYKVITEGEAGETDFGGRTEYIYYTN